MAYSHLVEPGTKADLDKIDPDHHGSVEKEAALSELEKLSSRIAELQELMFAASSHGLLIVMQGRDTAGKDGAINRILSYVNVQSAKVASFKVPTPKELSHDFLWRVHSETPGLGGITVFNRSHYEDVLVVRVHDLVPKAIWEGRYDHINNFEKCLVDSNTVVLKFCLHISKDEQKQRLLEREADPEKSWKLAVGDWKERDLWDEYTEAYNAALTNCSTKHAPWRIVLANHKWFRDLAIAEAIVAALEPLEKAWKDRLAAIGAKAKAELDAYRATASPKS